MFKTAPHRSLRTGPAPRAGFLLIEYFREMSVVAVVASAAFLLLQQSTINSVNPSHQAACSKLASAFTADGITRMQVAGPDNEVWVLRHNAPAEVIEATSGDLVRRYGLGEKSPNVLHVSRDGASFLVGETGGLVSWTCQGRCVHAGPLTQDRMSDSWTDASISDDGRAVLMTHEEGKCSLLRYADGVITVRPLPVSNAVLGRFSPDGREVLVGGVDGSITRFHLETERIVRTTSPAGSRCTALAWSDDGTAWAAGFLEGIVCTATFADSDAPPKLTCRREGIFQISSVVFSPCGQHLAFGGFNRRVVIADARTLADEKVLGQHEGPVRQIDFSNDGSRVYSAGLDGRLLIWSPLREGLLYEIPPTGEAI